MVLFPIGKSHTKSRRCAVGRARKNISVIKQKELVFIVPERLSYATI